MMKKTRYECDFCETFLWSIGALGCLIMTAIALYFSSAILLVGDLLLSELYNTSNVYEFGIILSLIIISSIVFGFYYFKFCNYDYGTKRGIAIWTLIFIELIVCGLIITLDYVLTKTSKIGINIIAIMFIQLISTLIFGFLISCFSHYECIKRREYNIIEDSS